MNNKIKLLIKAYWFRYWHCLYYSLNIRELIKNEHCPCGITLRDDLSNKEIIYIGCTCGKDWFNPRNNPPFKDWELAKRLNKVR